MCIINNKVESVSNTKILVATNKSCTRQLTVYGNTVDNKIDDNAMILPVPNPDTIIFHDLSEYKDIFNDCRKSFVALFKSRSKKSSNSTTLEVIDVGSYKVSIAKSLDDLKFVDTDVFNFKLNEECEKLLETEYSNPLYGFIICKLATSLEEYHPLGYSHDLMSENKLFIPTKHFHGDDTNNNDNLGNANDWSHEIYLYNATMYNNYDEMVKNTNTKSLVWSGIDNIKKDKINFDFADLQHFERHVIIGSHRNIDLTATVDITYVTYYTIISQAIKVMSGIY